MSKPTKRRKLYEEKQAETIEPNQLESEEMFLTAMELKIKEFPLMTEVVSSIIDPLSEVSEDSAVRKFKEKELHLINWAKENIDQMLGLAVKYKKIDVVNFLIKCGAKVNATDDGGKTAADYAWMNKNYRILMLILKADSFFPARFNLSELNEDDDGDNIRQLVGKRSKLHEAIENGEVEDVKNLTINESSKLFLNDRNESGAYIALKHKKFVTYAYLKSIGAEFGKDGEAEIIDTFDFKENVALQEAMVAYFPGVTDAPIHYLISKSRSQKPVLNLTDKLKYHYSFLNEIPEISLILKVVQYADYLDIIFDFDEEEISKVYPHYTSKDCMRGITQQRIGRIYIAASLRKRRRVEVLGTVAHELTHMAMQMLFENDCNPYGKDNLEKEVLDTVSFFKQFKNRIRQVSGEASKILVDAIDKYKDFDHDSELIVRVPHILAQYENGRDWLKTQVPEFLKFYEQKIVPKCHDFIRESVILKPKSMIKSINDSVGELQKLKRCKMFFNDAPNLFEKANKKIFVIEVESTLLGMLKVLQRLYGRGYINFQSHFLVLKFENFVSQLTEISQAFFLEGCEWLITEISHKPTEDELEKVCYKISELLEFKPHKKIIFVVHPKVTKYLRSELDGNGLLNISDEISDDCLRLDDLDKNSQELILKNKVFFQGKSISLSKLIQTPELYHFINPQIIESILEGRKVNIGNRILGLSSLEGPYSDIIREMDFNSFVRQVESSKDIFIMRSKPTQALTEYLKANFKEKWISTEFYKSLIYNFERKIGSEEKILLVNDRFRSDDLKNFCRVNPGKKCHLVDVKDLSTGSFVLKEIYNPNFYLKRRMKKIFIKSDRISKLINESKSEIFILSSVVGSKRYIFQGHSNVKCLDDIQAAENFKILSQQHKDVHWFKMENEQFTWKNSHGPTTSIKYIFKEIKADEESEEYDEDWEADLPEDDEDDSDLDHSNEYQNELRKQRAESRVLKEENLVSEILHKRVMLISDNPGTGKSTTITKLYEAKAIADTHWIIRINLKDYLKVIRFNITSKELDIEKIVRFLQDIDQSLKNELNENLLKEALTNGHNFPKCLLLAFDGYDEVIDDEDREKVIDLLKFLKKETHCKIWITSRLQYKQDLEYHLETFALEFDPFDYEMKKMFVEKYLKDRLKLILKENIFSEIFDGEKIGIFATKLLSKMRKIFMKDLTKFVGTPLQLNLVMFGSLDYFIKWIQGDEQSASLDFNYLGNDLQGVYENFIRQKYEIYFKKCDIIIRKRQKRDKRIAEEYHKDLAEALIYERKMLTPDDDDKELNLLVGLIQSQGKNNFEFIHFTFREYYFAETFADYVMTEELMDENNSKKVVFLFREIFVKREFEMIRSFFNIRFKRKIPDENIKELKKTFSDNKIIGLYTTLDSVLAVAAQEGCENNFNFFYSIYNYVFSSAPSYEITNILNRPLFSVSAISGKSEIWESLFRILKDVKLEKKWEEFYFKCLISESAHYATETKFWKLAKSLLENMKETFAPGEMRDFLTALDTKYATPYKIMEKGSSAEVFEFVMEILTKEAQYKFITMPNQYGPSALFAAARKKDPRFMELLLKKSEELMVSDDFIRFISSQNNVQNWLNHTFKATILHEAAWAGRLETIRLIFDKIEKLFDVNQQTKFFMAKNDKNRNALCNAVFVQHIAVVEFLISKAEKILTGDQLWEYITVADKWNKTILHLSLGSFNKIYIDVIKFIIQEAKRILPQEKLEEWMLMVEFPGPDSDLSGSALHRACVLGDVEILKYLLLKAHEILPLDRFQQFIKARNGLESNVFHLISKPNKPDAVKVLFEKLEVLLTPDDIIQLIMAKNRYGTILHEALFWGKMQTIETFITKTEKLLNPSQFRQLLMTKGSKRYFEMIFLRWVLVNPIELVLFVWEKIQKVIIPPDDLRQILLEKDMQYPNALYVALSNEDSKVLEFVMKQIERVLDEDKQRELLMTIGFSKRTILHTAVVKHLSESLRVMLKKMKDLLTEDELQQVLMNQDTDGNTVLHAAAADDNPDILKVFLDETKEIAFEKQRALFLLKNNDNEYCLSAGKIVDVKLEILKLLFERIQEIFPVQDQRLYLLESNNRGTIFHKAADFAKGDVLHFLFDKTKEILSPEDRRRLMTEEVNFRPHFLNFTMIPDFRNTILHIAAYSGKPEVIKTLLKNIDKEYERQLFMSQNQEDQTPFHAILSSCFSIEIEAVELLLEKLNQILMPEDWFKLLTIEDKINGTVLHSTALMNEIEIVILILKTIEKHLTAKALGQLLLIKHDELGSVLQAALYNEDPKVAKFILDKAKEVLNKEERSALLVTTDKSSRTALHTAASAEEPELKWDRRELTLQSTQVEFLNKLNDRTEFVYFFLKEAEELMTKEERGRFLDMKDSDGKTALHAAAQDGKLEAVKLLLQEAEKIFDGEALTNFVTAKSSGDQTALDLSSSANDYLIRNLLEKFIEEKIK